MSTPQQQPTEAPVSKPAEESTTSMIKGAITGSTGSVVGIIILMFGILAILIPAIGAAKLSHDRYGSIGWAIFAFIISPLYYVYYAYFVSTSTKYVQQPILGGKRRR